ncbi:hypothetical protein ES703_26820 [subsurface metagenome]
MTTMIVEPNPFLLHSIRGPVGDVVFQGLRGAHIARRRWTIRAPATVGQVAHRLAVERASALEASVRAHVLPAWLAYAASLGYGAFAAWQHENILPVKAGMVSCLAPVNAAYAPIASPNWQPGGIGEIDATWTYAGPAATVYVSTYYRRVQDWAWTFFATVDAADEAESITDLPSAFLYEVALAPHTASKLTWGQAYHRFRYTGQPPGEDFDTWTELDPNEHIAPDQYTVQANPLTRNEDAWLYDDKGLDHFGAAWTHQWKWDWIASSEEGAAVIWAVSNVVQDAQYWSDQDSQALWLEFYRAPGFNRLNFKNAELGEEHFFDDYERGHIYWPVVQRTSETAIEARVYEDEAHENLKHKHELAVTSGRRHRYVFAVNTVNSGDPPSSNFTITNLNLGLP